MVVTGNRNLAYSVDHEPKVLRAQAFSDREDRKPPIIGL